MLTCFAKRTIGGAVGCARLQASACNVASTITGVVGGVIIAVLCYVFFFLNLFDNVLEPFSKFNSSSLTLCDNGADDWPYCDSTGSFTCTNGGDWPLCWVDDDGGQ